MFLKKSLILILKKTQMDKVVLEFCIFKLCSSRDLKIKFLIDFSQVNPVLSGLSTVHSLIPLVRTMI